MSPSLKGTAEMPRILLVEDDPVLLWIMTASLTETGFQVQQANSLAAARAVLTDGRYDALLLDILLPDGDGLSLLPDVAAQAPELPVVVLSNHHEPAEVVRALRVGAIDYLAKPASQAELVVALERAIHHARQRQRISALQLAQQEQGFAGSARPLPIGSSPAWTRALELVHAAAQGPRTPVLLAGEPGVGKEVVATLVHHLSPRRTQPFVASNAACFSPQLVESELFGHEPGAFTGAQQRRRGLFELASGGTLFLDEIGELPLDTQAKLLRVLEGHPFRRVGGERDVTVDVRVICATNRDLRAQVAAGQFRADLLYRLRVFEIVLPPLRERFGDISELAQYFVAQLGAATGKQNVRISADALAVLESYSWPGNVRELRNVIERALLLSGGEEIRRRHLPSELARAPLPSRDRTASPPPPEQVPLLPNNLEEARRHQILVVFQKFGNNVTRAAAALGISRMTLRRRLQSYGVK